MSRSIDHRSSGGGFWIGATAMWALLATAVALGLSIYIWSRPPRDVVVIKPGAPVVFTTPGGLLLVTTIQATETFERTSKRKRFGMPLGTTVSKIRIPATYQYHIEMAKDWRAYVRDGKFLVIAPQVKPFVPVAINTSKMEMETKTGWLRFNGQENLDMLIRELSPELAKLATAPYYIELQREVARRAVADFATKWLIKQEQWKAVKPEQVKVYFSDESIEKLRAFGAEFAGT
ncbi:MAG: hypothetical protein ABIP49_00920 [Lysobacterales bacterium]